MSVEVNVAIVSGVTNPGAQRASKPLGGQGLPRPARRPPPQQSRQHGDIAGAKTPERQRNAEGCNRQPAERGADRATDVIARVVDCDRAVEIVLRHQHRRDNEPCRRSKRATPAQTKGRRQQHNRRGPMHRDQRREDDRYRSHGKLRADQQPARVDDVGQRASRQRQEKHRQRGGDLDRRNHHRIGIETGHEPVRRRVKHRESDIRRRIRNQDDGKRQIAENAPPPFPARGRVRTDA